jgi:hypothetical protein
VAVETDPIQITEPTTIEETFTPIIEETLAPVIEQTLAPAIETLFLVVPVAPVHEIVVSSIVEKVLERPKLTHPDGANCF